MLLSAYNWLLNISSVMNEKSERLLFVLLTDLHEEVCWGEDPKTDGKKGPALYPAPSVSVVHQLFTDLAVNFIPVRRGNTKDTK